MQVTIPEKNKYYDHSDPTGACDLEYNKITNYW